MPQIVTRARFWAPGLAVSLLLWCATLTAAAQEMSQNGGFESGGAPPSGWSQDKKQTGKKGRVTVDSSRTRSGNGALKLEPNKKNESNQPLAVFQIIPAAAHRGKRLQFSAYMYAEGGAHAAVGIISAVNGKLSNLVIISQAPSSDWVHQSNVYDVPDDPSVQLILTCYVAGTTGAAWFDDISVAPQGTAQTGRIERIPRKSAPVPNPAATATKGATGTTIEVDAGTVIRQIPETLFGTNVEWIWNFYGGWQEREGQVNPELVRLTRDMGVTVVRFPGGHFSDTYHWRDGIGPHAQRKEVRHTIGKNDKSKPNFGTDEVLGFAESIGGEALFTVNVGTGTAQEAADWVKYVNQGSTRVRFWEIGNELYINDGSTLSKAISIDPATYARRLREYATAMRRNDPNIKIMAIGGENEGKYAFINYPNWTRTVLENAGDHIDYLAVHNAYAPVLPTDPSDLRVAYRAMLAAPVLIARNLDRVTQTIKQHAPQRASKIGIAVTEWGPLFQFSPTSKYVDHAKTLGSALFAASTMKVFIESPQTQIANFFLLNDFSVLGWIGDRSGRFPPNPQWTPTAKHLALKMYTSHFGRQLVRTTATGPTFDTPGVGMVDPVSNVPYLDVVSSLSSDGRTLYILAINKHFDDAIEASLHVRGFTPRASATAWTLNGAGIDAHTGTVPLKILPWAKQVEDSRNPRFRNGGPTEITFESSPVNVAQQFKYTFPAHSVTSLVLTRAR